MRWLMPLGLVACAEPSISVTGFEADLAPMPAGLWSDMPTLSGDAVNHEYYVHSNPGFGCDDVGADVQGISGELATLRRAIEEATDPTAACEARVAYHQARLDLLGVAIDRGLSVVFVLIGPDSLRAQVIGAAPLDGAYRIPRDAGDEVALGVEWSLLEENPSVAMLDALDCTDAPEVVPEMVQPVSGNGQGTVELDVRADRLFATADLTLLDEDQLPVGTLTGTMRFDRCGVE